jgi:hypothetical protein
MNLKEAQKLGKIDEFIKEHEIEDPLPDGWERFWKLLSLMTEGHPASTETSDEELSEDFDEIEIPRGT